MRRPPRSRHLGPSAAIAAIAAVLAACAPRLPPPDLSLDPAELLAQVREAHGRVGSVRGEVRVRVKAPGGSGTVPGFVAAARPDRVYVQTVDFFGNTLSVLATAGGELSLYDARERVLYRGAATPENVARLVPVPLSPAELATVLCGTAPLLDGEPVRATPGAGFVELEIAAGATTQVLRVGPGARIVSSSMRVAGGGAGAYDVAFREHDAVPGRTFPGEVQLDAREPAVSLRLTWVDAEPGASLEPGLFSPGVPRGARIVDLEEVAPRSGPWAPPRPPGE
jgi:hypothetical protein